jgi:hypothetical protein
MKAISIRQPWAWLIVNGYKPVENRTWATKYRGPILIHASKTPALTKDALADLRRDLREQCGIVIPDELPVSGIVGQVDLVDCVTECTDPLDEDWHEPGCYAFILRNAKTLPFQPMTGKLNIFEVSINT